MLGFAKGLKKKLSKMESTRRQLHCLEECPVSKLPEAEMSSNWDCNDLADVDALSSQGCVIQD